MSKLIEHINETVFNGPDTQVSKDLKKIIHENRGKYFELEINAIIGFICDYFDESLTKTSKFKLHNLIHAINWHDIHYVNDEVVGEIIDIVLFGREIVC